MSDGPSRKLDQFIIRLPDGMRDRIKLFAEINGRSMNAEIVAALSDYYADMRVIEDQARRLVRTMAELEIEGRGYLDDSTDATGQQTRRTVAHFLSELYDMVARTQREEQARIKRRQKP